MLHSCDKSCCLRAPQQAAHISEARPKADAAHPRSPAEAVRALHKLVRVLQQHQLASLSAVSVQGVHLGHLVTPCKPGQRRQCQHITYVMMHMTPHMILGILTENSSILCA